MLPDKVTVRLDAIADFLSVLPGVQAEYDPESFCAVMRAVNGRRRLEMVYWTASRNETTSRLFDPYELSLIDDGWYAFGYCHRATKIRMFAVQRIRSLSDTGETFDRPADFRAEDYMKGSFRAMRGEGEYDVVLRFRADIARRFAEKRWHASQVVEAQSNGSLIVRMHLSSLVEIRRWVMWWGLDCEVLEPQELRDLVAQEVRAMLRREEGSGTSGSRTEIGTNGDRKNAAKRSEQRSSK
jgi:predicted DNA-binding transcriptional regulator YafY